MQKHLIFIVSVLALAVLQTTAAPIILPGWMQPDILLVVVVLSGLFLQTATGSIYAFGIGYLLDLLTGSVTGIFTFERLLIYLAAYWLSGQFYAKSPWIQALMVGILSILDYVLLRLLFAIFSGGDSMTAAFWEILPRSLSNAFVGLLLFYPLSMLWEGGQREF